MSDTVGQWQELLFGPKHSENIDQLATALAAAQLEIDSVKKTEDNPFFKSKYADLASVWAAIRGPFGRNGLSVVQIPMTRDGHAITITILMHKSGQWIKGATALKPAKSDPQGMGSGFTYGRRYSLMGFAGVAPDDDDGNDASEPPQNKHKSELKERKPTPHSENYQKLRKLLAAVGCETAEEAEMCVIYCSEGKNTLKGASESELSCQHAIDAVMAAHRQYPAGSVEPLINQVRAEMKDKK